tara:strand:+ start:2714 stop:3046 length:333 start_codon:yes stop_codon:yes gene_type:complete
MKTREEVLREAIDLITATGPRAEEYGDAKSNHQRIADLWSVILGIKVTAAQVVLCMIAVKIARLIYTIGHYDSWKDIAGYSGIGGEITSSPERDPQTTKRPTSPSDTLPD